MLAAHLCTLPWRLPLAPSPARAPAVAALSLAVPHAAGRRQGSCPLRAPFARQLVDAPDLERFSPHRGGGAQRRRRQDAALARLVGAPDPSSARRAGLSQMARAWESLAAPARRHPFPGALRSSAGESPEDGPPSRPRRRRRHGPRGHDPPHGRRLPTLSVLLSPRRPLPLRVRHADPLLLRDEHPGPVGESGRLAGNRPPSPLLRLAIAIFVLHTSFHPVERLARAISGADADSDPPVGVGPAPPRWLCASCRSITIRPNVPRHAAPASGRNAQ